MKDQEKLDPLARPDMDNSVCSCGDVACPNPGDCDVMQQMEADDMPDEEFHELNA